MKVHFAKIKPPRARKKSLVIQELVDEVLIYDLEIHKAHCLNRVAAAVWRCCDGRTTVQEIAKILHRDLAIPLNQELVWSTLRELEKARLLQGPLQAPGKRISRRELIKRLGRAGAIALAIPAVTTIFVPEASAQASCLPPGASCTADAQCCNNACVLSICL